MNNLFIFFKMAIKIAELALERNWVGRVSGNTGIFVLGLTCTDRLIITFLRDYKPMLLSIQVSTLFKHPSSMVSML